METFIIRQPAQVTRNAFQTFVCITVKIFNPIKTAGQVMTVQTTQYALITNVTFSRVKRAAKIMNACLELLAKCILIIVIKISTAFT